MTEKRSSLKSYNIVRQLAMSVQSISQMLQGLSLNWGVDYRRIFIMFSHHWNFVFCIHFLEEAWTACWNRYWQIKRLCSLYHLFLWQLLDSSIGSFTCFNFNQKLCAFWFQSWNFFFLVWQWFFSLFYLLIPSNLVKLYYNATLI